MTKIDFNRTINISVSVRVDQYIWLQKNSFNKSKMFQVALDKLMKKNGDNTKTSKAKTNIK